MGNLKIKVMKSEGGEQISLGTFENSMYTYPRDFNTWSWGGYTPSTHSGSGKTPSLTAIVTDGNMLSHRHLGAKKEKEKWRLGKTEIVVQDISLLRNKSRGNASWVLSSLSPQFKEPRKVLQGKAKVPGGIFSVAVRMASHLQDAVLRGRMVQAPLWARGDLWVSGHSHGQTSPQLSNSVCSETPSGEDFTPLCYQLAADRTRAGRQDSIPAGFQKSKFYGPCFLGSPKSVLRVAIPTVTFFQGLLMLGRDSVKNCHTIYGKNINKKREVGAGGALHKEKKKRMGFE